MLTKPTVFKAEGVYFKVHLSYKRVNKSKSQLLNSGQSLKNRKAKE